ncbi:PAS domain S-box-containing protein [Ereboglobus sp. PH5-10]|uniref:PAS domain-containing sensor histidine kinase n=1 Tax=Ereboglobus sp. PH5-10 TaxID=2940629 RepID=UPI0024068916|nr:PAS domain-containing hybrid sensor histidine kinase/response regulator [Ereboglobus sp. PH5-10]MDF9827346.1 PAS domain S-box-containing protein [Ereboglobus sp. PH5-10]
MKALSGRQKAVIVFALILTVSVCAGVARCMHRSAFHRQNAAAGLKMLALSFSDEDLADLTNDSPALRAKVRAELEKRMDNVRDAAPSVKTMELLRCDTRTGEATCLVHSSPPDTPETPPAGERCTAFVKPELIQRLVNKNEPVVHLHILGPAGGFIVEAHAFVAPSVTPLRAQPAADIVRYNLDGKTWFSECAADGGRGLLVCLILMGMPFAAYGIARRSTGRERMIEGLRMAADQCENAIMIAGLDAGVIYANGGLARQTGYSRDELLAMRAPDLAAEDVSERLWMDSWNKGFPPDSEVMLRRKNGEPYPANVVSTAVRRKNGRGDVFSCIFIITDLTERTRRNQQLQQARHSAENASRAKGAFLAMMSHEVRTPLNGVLGFSSLLADTELDGRQRECVEDIRKNGEMLARLSADILDLSRIESGSAQLHLDCCNLRSLIDDVVNSVRETTAKAPLEYAARADAAVPVEIMVDSMRLRQILANYTLNAAGAISAGKIELAASVTDNNDGMVTLRFSIRGVSTGAAPSPAPSAKVSSLAMTISRHLIQLMNGEIIAENSDKTGSVFVFSIQCERC